MTKKTINLGEYLITIYHNEKEERLEVRVFDELGDMIEAIIISNDDNDEIEDGNDKIDFNLN